MKLHTPAVLPGVLAADFAVGLFEVRIHDRIHVFKGVPPVSYTHLEDETDEHLWLSLKMSREFCRATASQLAALNPTAAAAYQASAAAYIQKLDALDGKITKLVRQSTCKTLIFADRYPFKYFCDDYGLAHEAAFPGCSAETEASFETIISLADDLKALPKSRLVTLDGGSAALAETITRAAELPETQIVTLYSCLLYTSDILIRVQKVNIFS